MERTSKTTNITHENDYYMLHATIRHAHEITENDSMNALHEPSLVCIIFIDH